MKGEDREGGEGEGICQEMQLEKSGFSCKRSNSKVRLRREKEATRREQIQKGMILQNN